MEEEKNGSGGAWVVVLFILSLAPAIDQVSPPAMGPFGVSPFENGYETPDGGFQTLKLSGESWLIQRKYCGL